MRAVGLIVIVSLLSSACDRPVTTVGESDFAVLAQAAEGYAEARPGHVLEFPRDHGPHPEFRIEWWYLTANLEGADGQLYGAQWTLFRSAVQPPGSFQADNPWQSEQVYMAHFALTSPQRHFAFQRYARGGWHSDQARAGVVAEPFSAWLDDWSLRSAGPGWLPLQAQASQDGYAMTLTLESDRPPVLQGENGFSQKHPNGGGSYYYSHPFLNASGELEFDGSRIAVQGKAWLDREWSSQFLQSDQAGWDWFALHLESGEKLMLFRLREARGVKNSGGAFRHGVLIAADGSRQSLDPERMEFKATRHERVSGRELPMTWRVRLPEIERELTVTALHPEQWMDVDFPYWEGVVTVSGEGEGSRGVGYLEMTGYRD